jgi:hypothetical protein
MNSTNARRTVITTLTLTAVLAVIRNVSNGDVPDVPKLVIGGVFAGVVLTLAAEPAPELAAAIAFLILVGAIVGNGPAVWESISKNALGASRTGTAKGSPLRQSRRHGKYRLS